MSELLSSLLKIAAGRDHITTPEFARAASKSPQTVRKNYCLTGHCYGVVPVKIGNRLLWPVRDTADLLCKGENVPAADAKGGVSSTPKYSAVNALSAKNPSITAAGEGA